MKNKTQELETIRAECARLWEAIFTTPQWSDERKTAVKRYQDANHKRADAKRALRTNK